MKHKQTIKDITKMKNLNNTTTHNNKVTNLFKTFLQQIITQLTQKQRNDTQWKSYPGSPGVQIIS